jgi:hypothetical protein
MNYKNSFIDIFNENIKREGSDKLLDYLQSTSSDFFTAPASMRFHSAYEGGLVEHSVNVYNCLVDYLDRDRVRNIYKIAYDNESIAIVSLLHDICKINCYKPSTRNVKDENGVWNTIPTYLWDDSLPYGHGEKSVYIISGFMRLTREESFAIRYHMGFSGIEDRRDIGNTFEMFPLAFALSTADMEATYYIDGKNDLE